MIVTQDKTALAVGSGDLEVLATPVMIALMENAAMEVALNHCAANQTTVGTKLNVQHTRATGLGGKVSAKAKLTHSEGRKLVFEVTAQDENGEIGHGTHERFIVEKEKFLAKL